MCQCMTLILLYIRASTVSQSRWMGWKWRAVSTMTDRHEKAGSSSISMGSLIMEQLVTWYLSQVMDCMKVSRACTNPTYLAELRVAPLLRMLTLQASSLVSKALWRVGSSTWMVTMYLKPTSLNWLPRASGSPTMTWAVWHPKVLYCMCSMSSVKCEQSRAFLSPLMVYRMAQGSSNLNSSLSWRLQVMLRGIGRKLSSVQVWGSQRGPQPSTAATHTVTNTNTLIQYVIKLNPYNRQNSMFKKRNKDTQRKQIDIDEIQPEPGPDSPNQPAQAEPETSKKKEPANLIGGSTNARKTQTEQATHEKFQSLNYKKGQQEQEEVLAGDQAAETETELAKRRYLENVEMTKKIKEGKLDSKIYRGANNYANYRLTDADLANPTETYKWKHGPTRAKGNSTQSTCRFDYDPSLCKDFHDCGYCVFGNSCIYLHDRSNYKSGWELEKDFERAERERWRRINNPDLADEEPDYLKDLEKFKPQENCSYCAEALKDPVEVACRHIYCLKCAGEMEHRDGKCNVCGKKLDGIMNSAEKALRKQKQQYEEMLKMAEKGKEAASSKRSKYRGLNSLDVFTANG